MSIAETAGVRRATAADAADLKSLREASLRSLATETYDPATIQSLIRHAGTGDAALAEAGTLFVLELDGEIVACGGWAAEQPDDEAPRYTGTGSIEADAAIVGSVYVDPDFARRGLGTRIMGLLEADAAAAGYRKLRIAATLNAMPLCTRLGYRPARLVDLGRGEGSAVTGVEMAKLLPTRLARAA